MTEAKEAKLIAAACALLLASGASAQISNIGATSSATLTLDGAVQSIPSPVPSPIYRNGGPGGAGYSTSADIGGSSIFFQSGSMAAGNRNSASSSIELSFDVTGTGVDITKMTSTIFESNFGFHVGNFTDFVDPDTGDLVRGCSGANLPNCVPTTFSPGFSGFRAPGTAERQTLATTQFTFDVLQDGALVQSISGSLDMVRDGRSVIFVPGLGFSGLASALNNFTLFEVTDKVYAFSWDRTNFTVDLLNPIGMGETSTLTYRITSASQNFATPLGGEGATPSANLIVAFACLADPIGRGGTSSAAVFTIPGFGPSTCDDYDGAATSGRTDYPLSFPRIVGDTLVFTAPPIPEPDTWAMLIVGFGLVGLSLRRAQRPARVSA